MRYVAITILLLLASCAERLQADAIPLQPMPSLAAWKPSAELADKMIAGGSPEVALHITDQLLARNPRNAGALVRRGDALIALHRNPEAAAAYSKSVELEPHNNRALLGLGKVRLAQDPAAAEALFARITSRDGRDAVALNDLGVARDMQGHHAAAQEAYHKALEAAPSLVAAQVNLGLSMALSGEAAAAMRLLQPIATAPQAPVAVRHDLALATALNGQREQASAMLAPDLSPDEVRRALDGFAALRL